jgi:archaeal flagellin FlaB
MISFRHKDEGFTGLEAAIVLIAFVVVAAVFSYVVLGAGFFTTQKSQEVVHTGVQQASSTLEIVGNVYGLDTTAAGTIDTINFTVSLAPGGTPVDLSKMILTYTTESYSQTMDMNPTYTAAAGKWGINAIRGGNWDNLLEKGEQVDIGILPGVPLTRNQAFDLEVKPIIGASLDIKRTAPASVKAVNILY